MKAKRVYLDLGYVEVPQLNTIILVAHVSGTPSSATYSQEFASFDALDNALDDIIANMLSKHPGVTHVRYNGYWRKDNN